MSLVGHRQKLIRLADRSENGWKVVKEYESDSLADNEDDEKRIAKAEKAAASAAAAKSKKRAPPKPFVQVPARVPQNQFRGNWPTRGRTFPQYPPGPPPAGRSFGPTAAKPIGPCYRCSEMGHLQSSCPRMSTPQYPPHSCTEIDGWGEHPFESSDSLVDMSCRYWEASEHGVENVRVKGRLKQHVSFWRNVLTATPYIIDVIQNGYRLPLISMPPSYSASNHSSAMENVEFVTGAVSELINNGCARLVADKPFICSPLLVVQNSVGKKRLVISLKFLNLYLWKCKFKYEDFKTALDYFEKDAYLFTFDLKSGYHHLDIHPEHQTYLGFQWEGKFYVFTVLPFGLSTACYIFTKLLRPMVKHIRALGVRLVLYLDDGIVSVKALEAQAIAVSELVQDTLTKAGLVINKEKSRFTPSKQASWLGFDIDLAQGKIRVPQEKLHAVKLLLQTTVSESIVAVRLIASVVGKIIAMSLALGDIARLRTRCLYSIIQSRASWSDRVVITPEAKEELLFWIANIDSFNGRCLWRAPSAVRVVYSDASNTGFGGYAVEHGNHIAHGQWSPEESQRSSSWRELRAVTLTLKAFAKQLANHRVRWFTDNQNVAHIIKVGSKKVELQAEALDIFKLSVQHNIIMEPEWIPREQNEVADYLSRIMDYDDWGLSVAAFQLIEDKWGPHTVDRFANSTNAKLLRFNSRFLDIGSEAVDAFTVHWGSENNYFCPPVYLIPRLLFHAMYCKCVGTLIVPEWPSAAFWPLISDSHGSLVDFVKDYLLLPLSPGLFVKGKRGACLFKDGIPTSNVLAVRVDFTGL